MNEYIFGVNDIAGMWFRINPSGYLMNKHLSDPNSVIQVITIGDITFTLYKNPDHQYSTKIIICIERNFHLDYICTIREIFDDEQQRGVLLHCVAENIQGRVRSSEPKKQTKKGACNYRKPMEGEYVEANFIDKRHDRDYL
jgi:hypothetical protein